MAHKKIQALSLQGQFNTKAEAIKAMEDYVVANIGDFIDGESVTVRYSDATGEVCSVSGIVNISDGNVSVSVAIEEHETLKVVESDTEPEDKDVLWVDTSSVDDTGNTPITTDIIQQDIQALNRAIQSLYTIVGRHQYAFEHTINPGDITNSAKGDMEDFADPEPPVGYEKYDTSGDTDFEYNESGMPMEKPVIVEPTAKHILVKYAATLEDIKKMQTYILEHEMVWCDGNMTMYIKAKGQLWPISGRGNGEVIPGGDDSGNTNPDIDINEIMSGITQSGASIASIQFVAPSGAKYITAVDNNGNLNVYDEDEYKFLTEKVNDAATVERFYKNTTGFTIFNGTVDNVENVRQVEVNGGKVTYKNKVYINEVYCGGNANEHSYNPCSHNFVELANLSDEDFNLSGVSLEYAEAGRVWSTLPLNGVIKAGSTYVVRGAQCSVMDVNTTVIKVKNYDIEWKDASGSPIKFSNVKAKFYLKATTASTISDPYQYNEQTNGVSLQYGYIDLVGFGATIDACEGTNPANNSVKNFTSNKLFVRYYTMDPVNQATKDLTARKNDVDWAYIDLTKKSGEVIPDVECYTPKASWEGKNIFFNKTGLKEDRPTVITCSFGIQATDNGAGATRCFNWISKGYHNEYLWINSSKSFTGAQKHESMDGETDPTKAAYYYNRIRQEATDGTPFTVHKLVVKNLAAGTYYYAAGPDSAHTTEWHSFKVVTDATANAGFSFVQTSDQQGFNWEEYQVWKACADYITENETPAFMINTGDMAQNGNRINEWLDYFNAKGKFHDMEEMATIGNNDLCPDNNFKLGDGTDAKKINAINITYFYTFELDDDNLPVFNVDGDDGTKITHAYVPSLYSFNYGDTHFICMNSEITSSTEKLVYGLKDAETQNYGYFYQKIKNWCQTDFDKYSKDGKWTIAYCHEMPFTIITDDLKNSFYNGTVENNGTLRGGSKLNINSREKYWFSQFCQNNGIRLVLGGHKHTQATSWPIRENVKDGALVTMKPIIEVTASDLSNVFGATTLKTVNDAASPLNGYKYPDTWFNADGSINDSAYSASTHFCTFELVDKATAPIYAMSQSSGYKHTSNKELPANIIPWLRNYHPKNGTKANATQLYPFYTIWNVTNGSIKGYVKKVCGIFNAGKFNINVEGASVAKGNSADPGFTKITAVNGLNSTLGQSDTKFEDANIIIINK